MKALGDHTARLGEIPVGTRVFAEGPFGVFTAAASRTSKALLIAGGIGITPVRALLERMDGDVVVLYRVVSSDEIVFGDELDRLAAARGARVEYVIGDHRAPRVATFSRHATSPGSSRTSPSGTCTCAAPRGWSTVSCPTCARPESRAGSSTSSDSPSEMAADPQTAPGLPVRGLRLSAEATRSPRWDTRTVKLLLVEDEDAIAEPLAEGLRREGFAVERVATGAAALEASEPDVVLLDIGLPDTDGLAVCRELRSRSEVPIIMVTAKGEEIDRVVGLEVGADDYIVKPFGFRELIARIRAVTRRTAPRATSPTVELGPLVVDTRTRRVAVDGNEVDLSPKEFDLLALLASDPGAVVSRRRILEEVWETTWFGSSKTIDVHMAALRRKLGDPAWIETVRGVGFRLHVP